VLLLKIKVCLDMIPSILVISFATFWRSVQPRVFLDYPGDGDTSSIRRLLQKRTFDTECVSAALERLIDQNK